MITYPNKGFLVPSKSPYTCCQQRHYYDVGKGRFRLHHASHTLHITCKITSTEL